MKIIQSVMTNISSTSALVLLWTNGKIHKSCIAKKFLNLLCLKPGKDLLEKCNGFWPHYNKVIQNRKSCILYLTKNIVLQNNVRQIIILGAGYDALSLEICSWSNACKVFEVDTENMKTKNDLISLLSDAGSQFGSVSDSVTCIVGDVTNSNHVISALIKHGWDRGVPSLIVIEGLSYYISKSNLYDLIDKFKTKNQSNHVILEYLLPDDKISKKWLAVSRYPFDLIAKCYNLDCITRYDACEIATHLKEHGGIISRHYTQSGMKKDGDLQNPVFSSENDGWIEVCEILI